MGHFAAPYFHRMAQPVKNPPTVQETWVWYLGWEDTLEKGTATHSSIPAWRFPWTIVHGVAKSWTWLSNFEVQVQFYPWTFAFSPFRSTQWKSVISLQLRSSLNLAARRNLLPMTSTWEPCTTSSCHRTAVQLWVSTAPGDWCVHSSVLIEARLPWSSSVMVLCILFLSWSFMS